MYLVRDGLVQCALHEEPIVIVRIYIQMCLNSQRVSVYIIIGVGNREVEIKRFLDT
jgi:hypothetical protein